MHIYDICLAQRYPCLRNRGADPRLTAYIQEETLASPNYAPASRPALLILPGGGYGYVSPREGEPIALAFMDMGFNCFILKYSVAPHTYPQALLEVSAAVELICENLQPWNIREDQILICGFSAGGHLAASYCTLRSRPEITAHFPPRSIRGAILCYPVISAQADICHQGSFRNLLGCSEPTPEQLEAFSLERLVDPALTPPTFLWHTASDPAVPVENSLVYAQALSRCKIPYELHIFPQGGHGAATADRQTLQDFDNPTSRYIHNWIPLCRNWLQHQIL